MDRYRETYTERSKRKGFISERPNVVTIFLKECAKEGIMPAELMDFAEACGWGRSLKSHEIREMALKGIEYAKERLAAWKKGLINT